MYLRKLVYFFAVSFAVVLSGKAQFTTGGGNTYVTTGNVGIGTATPVKPLHILNPNGLRLEGTAYGTNILDLVPGQTTIWDRLDIKSVNANRGSSLMFVPNGTATSAKIVMSNQSDMANYSSMYILTEGTGGWISPQNIGTPDNSIADLSLGGGTGGRYWTTVVVPSGKFGIGTATPLATFDVGRTVNNTLSSVLSRLPEANASGEGTYLGVRAGNTQPNNVTSFSLEHKFGGQLNNAINFNRGSAYQGGFITIATNDGTEKMRIDAAGNVGIGTTTPAEVLHVIGNIGAHNSETGTANGVTINAGNTTTAASTNVNRLRFGGSDLNSSYFTIQGPSNTDILTINNGSVGIGTTIPGTYKLAVEGTIGARKVKVTSAAWADYVFDENYKLPSLNEVENFIQQNKHLPDVPSAKEVAANGIDLGDNQVVLLKKVEELTLYLIEMKKENELKSNTISVQDKKLTLLEKQMKEQEKLLHELAAFIQKK